MTSGKLSLVCLFSTCLEVGIKNPFHFVFSLSKRVYLLVVFLQKKVVQIIFEVLLTLNFKILPTLAISIVTFIEGHKVFKASKFWVSLQTKLMKYSQ